MLIWDTILHMVALPTLYATNPSPFTKWVYCKSGFVPGRVWFQKIRHCLKVPIFFVWLTFIFSKESEYVTYHHNSWLHVQLKSIFILFNPVSLLCEIKVAKVELYSENTKPRCVHSSGSSLSIFRCPYK